MVGFAGEAQGFDGNGSYVRTATGGGDILIKTGKLSRPAASRDAAVRATRSCRRRARARSGRRSKPPYKTSRACYKNAQPNLNGPAASAGPPDTVRGGQAVRHAIQKHLRDFIAVIVMSLLALLVAGYILSHQRFYLPDWVPVRRHRLLRAEGRVRDRAVGHARPGPDGRHRRRAGRRDQEGRARGRPRGRDDVDQAEVRRPDQARRHDAAAAQDRPQGHDHRDGPGHAELRPRSRTASRSRSSQTEPGRQPRRDPLEPRPRHARLPAAAGRGRRRGTEGQRPRRCREHAAAVRAAQPRRQEAHRPARQAAREPRAA